jgi:TGS domain-containing protein
MSIGTAATAVGGNDPKSPAPGIVAPLPADANLQQYLTLTPQPRVIPLPQGSTPLDFAYHLHSELELHSCGRFALAHLAFAIPPQMVLRKQRIAFGRIGVAYEQTELVAICGLMPRVP